MSDPLKFISRFVKQGENARVMEWWENEWDSCVKANKEWGASCHQQRFSKESGWKNLPGSMVYDFFTF